MSYVKPVSVLVLLIAAGLCAGARAEEPAKKEEPKEAKKDDSKEAKDAQKAEKEKAKKAEKEKKLAEKAEKEKQEAAEKGKKAADKAEKEKQEAAEKEKKEAEKAASKKEEKAEPKEKKKDDKKETAAAAPVEIEPAPPTAEQIAAAAEAKEKAAREIREAAQALVEQDVKMRAAVKKLASPGWREAQVQLIASGKTAAPYLIEALGEGVDGATPAAYNLGGHTKADAGRATRQRTLAEVAAEVLTELVKNHSDFKGEVPAIDQRAWQTWWTLNGGAVTFGK